jgi:hypothetical protein
MKARGDIGLPVVLFLALPVALQTACGDDGSPAGDAGLDAGMDAGSDADAGSGTDIDAGVDAGLDAGAGTDTDTGTDFDTDTDTVPAFETVACADDTPCLASGLVCNEVWGICAVAECAGVYDFTPCELDTASDAGVDRSYDICVDGACVSPGCGDATCNAPSPHFPLPDTGQRLCYGPEEETSCLGFAYGQDAKYGWDTTHDAAERYTRDTSEGGNPIVVDNVTGLVWQGCALGASGDGCEEGGDPTPLVWADALAGCDALSWGGSDDWRLPDEFELQTLVNYGRSSAPVVDTGAFPATPSDWFWSSSSWAADPIHAWGADFGYGAVSVPSKDYPGYARCVRGTPTPRPARFTRISPGVEDPIVVDNRTGLIWQGCLAGQDAPLCWDGVGVGGWLGGHSFCVGSSWGGFTDWRMPNIEELRSLVDNRLDLPALDGDAFPVFTSGYWVCSSTTVPSFPSKEWSVNFTLGALDDMDKNECGVVLCVRGGL